jgi:hypothetical protein
MAGTTDTLGAAVANTTTTSFVFTTGTFPNGIYVTVDSEIVYIASGTGVNREVERGQLGSTAATHSNGATVAVPGALSFTLLSLAELTNQQVKFMKISGDLNYVQLFPAGGETLPDGAAYAILSDTSSARGTFIIEATG